MNQKGFARILIILFFLVGLAVAVILVQRTTNIFPKASNLSVTLENIKYSTDKCSTILNNGRTNAKINLYFYEDGFNSDLKSYDDYIGKIIAVTFGGSFGGESFSGIEPFRSLKGGFNIFSYKDEKNMDDGECWPITDKCTYFNKILPELQANCPGFVAPSDWGEDDGNYNIVVIPFNKEGWGSSSRTVKRINSNTVRITSADTIYHNINFPIASLVHEFGHRIGFLGEEYFYYNPYLGADTIAPNVDSFNCNKWGTGVNKQSSCYGRYTEWLEFFKTNFINGSKEIQDILVQNNLNYDTKDYSWWGICFNARNINKCGNRIAFVLDSNIRPEVQGLTKSRNEEWFSKWEQAKIQFSDVAGVDACNLGFDNEKNACYASATFSAFFPSPENSSIMGSQYQPTDSFNKHDESILKYNILNKIRYIDVENIEGAGGPTIPISPMRSP